jgi:hypothetical protein
MKTRPAKSPVTERALVARVRRKIGPHWSLSHGRDPHSGERAWLLIEGNTIRDTFTTASALARFARERGCLAEWEALEEPHAR